MRAYRYRVADMPPLAAGIHLDEDASRAFPERTNYHVHLARGTAFVQVGDVVLVSDRTDHPIAALTSDEFDEMVSSGLDVLEAGGKG